MYRLKLTRPIAGNTTANAVDIVNAKTALSYLGYYPRPTNGVFADWLDSQVFDGIRRFQIENGLEVDGAMRPGGPTERKLNGFLRSGDGATAGPRRKTPVIIPPKVDLRMPQIRELFQPESHPYVDEHGNIILEGINPKTGFRVRRPKRT